MFKRSLAFTVNSDERCGMISILQLDAGYDPAKPAYTLCANGMRAPSLCELDYSHTDRRPRQKLLMRLSYVRELANLQHPFTVSIAFYEHI